MRTISYLVASLALGGTAFAQTPDGSTSGSSTEMAQISTASSSQGIIVAGGRAYQINGTQVTPIEQAMNVRIDPNGILTGFDGRKYQIPAGQMLTSEGRFAPIPQGIAGLPDEARKDNVSRNASSNDGGGQTGAATPQQAGMVNDTGAVNNSSQAASQPPAATTTGTSSANDNGVSTGVNNGSETVNSAATASGASVSPGPSTTTTQRTTTPGSGSVNQNGTAGAANNGNSTSQGTPTNRGVNAGSSQSGNSSGGGATGGSSGGSTGGGTTGASAGGSGGGGR